MMRPYNLYTALAVFSFGADAHSQVGQESNQVVQHEPSGEEISDQPSDDSDCKELRAMTRLGIRMTETQRSHWARCASDIFFLSPERDEEERVLPPPVIFPYLSGESSP
jgi:hypothetical protein